MLTGSDKEITSVQVQDDRVVHIHDPAGANSLAGFKGPDHFEPGRARPNEG